MGKSCTDISSNGEYGNAGNLTPSHAAPITFEDVVCYGNCSANGGEPYDDTVTAADGGNGADINGLRCYVGASFLNTGGTGVNGTAGMFASYIAGVGWTG